MVLLAAASDLLVVFIALEILSLSLYVLAGQTRRLAAQEAAMKYFLLGAFSSAFLLYGIALCYGATGTTNLLGIARASGDPTGDGTLLLAGVGLLAVGFLLQGVGGAVPHVDPRRLPGHPDPGGRVHGRRHQGGRPSPCSCGCSPGRWAGWWCPGGR